jgi:WXXGXW repeat (2 copies)
MHPPKLASPHQTRSWALVVALAATTAVSGCVVWPGGYHGHRGYGGRGGVVVSVAPPLPQVDVRVRIPGPGHFWIGGHWGWLGSRHAWVDGRWEAERQGQRWVPHQWMRDNQGWYEVPGHWAPR